jgi:hypothetical protein
MTAAIPADGFQNDASWAIGRWMGERHCVDPIDLSSSPASFPRGFPMTSDRIAAIPGDRIGHRANRPSA